MAQGAASRMQRRKLRPVEKGEDRTTQHVSYKEAEEKFTRRKIRENSPRLNEVYQVTAKTIANQYWRLNNLYYIENKEGEIVKFELNDAQEEFYHKIWYLNVILKARQLGFSTFIDLFFLDVSVFNFNVRCGIIDASIADAKKKLSKIKFAYNKLPAFVRNGTYIVQENAFELMFSNGSSISVGTSHRGGTLQYLHISELGKIAAKFPEKAREIRTGALNTVQAGQFVFIESTAEGQDGDFFNVCQAAEAKVRMDYHLTPLDFKFHFHPWFRDPSYALDNNEVAIPEEFNRYFDKLEKDEGISLSIGQKAWYIKKAETQRDEMKREYPATPKEAFEAAIEGAIFGPYMAAAEADGRVGTFPYLPGIPVHTFWDIGRKDYTSIWFAQIYVDAKGRSRVRVIGFYQNCLIGMPHYAEYVLGTKRVLDAKLEGFVPNRGKIIRSIYKRKGWLKGFDIFPHDAKVTEWGSDRSRIEQLKKVGFEPQLATELSLHDGINAARSTIGLCEFDEAGCGEGLKVLRLYRWEADERGGFKTGTERHDVYSHGAAAFRYLGTSWRELKPEEKPKEEKTHQVITTEDDGSLNFHAGRASEIIAIRKRLKEMERRR